MKEISTSIYTFEELVKGCCLYVDKTEYFYRLISVRRGQFFCARPRRFGKSLAISTLEAIFLGKKELFRGLSIYDRNYDWEEYPVVHLDFARFVMRNQDLLNRSLCEALKKIGRKYQLNYEETDAAILFSMLLEELYEKTGKGVVLLIDEYDKPLLDHMDSLEEAVWWRDYMDSFFQIIKGSERFLRFVFITGVTKFAKVSIFSKLNNLNDITMDEDYAAMFGYTQKELEENFNDCLEEAVRFGTLNEKGQGLSKADLLTELKRWYDGFQFSEQGENVYNPVSIGSFFTKRFRFQNYWFTTGTPGFLIRLLRQNHLVLADVQEVIMSENAFNIFDVTELAGKRVSKEKLKQMLYQTGYLTLDGLFQNSPRMYRLRFPNKEVGDSFAEQLVYAYAGDSETISLVEDLVLAALAGNTNELIDAVRAFFAALPYDIQIPQEKYYQSIVYTIFKMCGMDIVAEDRTNTGRIDAVLEMEKHINIIEFKFYKTAKAALEQIDEKKYIQKYIWSAEKRGQLIHKLAMNFCFEEGTRNITDWKEEIVKV